MKLYLHCTDLIPELSLLSWERGLKYRIPNFNSNKKFVAPLVGAWIEIHMEVDGTCLPIVAPLVGAWIEIFNSFSLKIMVIRRSSRGSVD